MGLLARMLACTAATSVVACAALAGLEDPDPIAAEDAGPRTGSLQDTGTGSAPDRSAPPPDGSTPDTSAIDASVDAPKSDGCTLGQNADPCAKGSDCCSGKCGERRECVSTCTSSGNGCDPTSTSSCCVGLWCSGSSFTCVPCILSGQPAASAGPVPLAQSCCSRTLKIASNQCQ
jgi:hypothetical protein